MLLCTQKHCTLIACHLKHCTLNIVLGRGGGGDKSNHVPLHTKALLLHRLSSEARHLEHSPGQGRGGTNAFMFLCTQKHCSFIACHLKHCTLNIVLGRGGGAKALLVEWFAWREMGWVSWLVWDELKEMSWDELSEMSWVAVGWGELSQMSWVKLSEEGWVRWVEWVQLCEMNWKSWVVWNELGPSARRQSP